jgi:hypothetical protein
MRKVFSENVILDVPCDVRRGFWILIKNLLHNLLGNRETNLLSLINPSLAHLLL